MLSTPILLKDLLKQKPGQSKNLLTQMENQKGKSKEPTTLSKMEIVLNSK